MVHIGCDDESTIDAALLHSKPMKRRNRKERGEHAHQHQNQHQKPHKSSHGQQKLVKSKREANFSVQLHPPVDLKQIVWNYRKRLQVKPINSTADTRAKETQSTETTPAEATSQYAEQLRPVEEVNGTAKDRRYSEDDGGSLQKGRGWKGKDVVITYPVDDAQGREEYTGSIRSGKLHGHGTLQWTCGNKYVGQFENDKLTGVGTYYWNSGKVYSGEWTDGRANGYGTLKMNNADADKSLLEYDGAWKNGLMSGTGTAKMLNGDTYQGEWFCSHKHGRGVYVWANGCRYEGDFRQNLLHGEGTCYWPNGRVLKLTFENNCATDAMECSWSIYYFFIVASIVNIFYDFALNPQGPQIRAFPSGGDVTAWNVTVWYKTLFAQLLPEVRLLLLFFFKMRIVKMVGNALTKFAMFVCLKRSSKGVPNSLCWKEGVGLGSVLLLALFVLTFLIG